ncbi:MAG: nucleotidyltransferase family protein [Cellvibrio sp.]
MSLHTLILAAGRGSRFTKNVLSENPKQLAIIDGQPMLRCAVNLANALTPGKVTVVLGYRHELMQPLVRDVNLVVNPEWEKGIGCSIACGVAALPTHASAVLIFLCDQMALNTADLKRLQILYESATDNKATDIVCAKYDGSFGVPAIFPRRYFSQLIALDSDQGAKQILYKNPVISLPIENAALDIDTWEQWNEFTTRSFNNIEGDKL